MTLTAFGAGVGGAGGAKRPSYGLDCLICALTVLYVPTAVGNRGSTRPVMTQTAFGAGVGGTPLLSWSLSKSYASGPIFSLS